MNTLACPYCHIISTLDPLADFRLPARDQYLHRRAELIQCRSCQQVYLKVHEETPTVGRRPNVWNTYHYYLPTKLQRDILISATQCATPQQGACQCQMHILISEIDFAALQRLNNN